MIEVMIKLCKQLDGWNFHIYKESENNYHCIFDFYSNDGDAVLTMHSTNSKIELANDVEFWNEEYYSDYEPITLEEYNKRLEEQVNV